VSSAKKIVAITTGDHDGIGLEVSIKALRKIGPQRSTHFILCRSAESQKKQPFTGRSLGSQFSVHQYHNIEDAIESTHRQSSDLSEVILSSSPARWVEEVALLSLQKKISAICTGPLSKQEITNAGMADIGHTDILRRITGGKTALMGFFGKFFRVVLATGHIPLKNVEQTLTPEYFDEAIKIALNSRSLLPGPLSKKPVGVLGLNPHAGDHGLIGGFESSFLRDFLSSAAQGSELIGPLIPDVAFHPSNWSKYSYYMALYHDQGLIPFKMKHGFSSGVHVTLGLPIVRTSVDHGTAKDLFGLNKADSGSMTDALLWACRLAEKNKRGI